CPDEADLLTGREARAGDDLRVENGEMAVRPDLTVVRTEGQADPAGRIRGGPGPEHDRVCERVERRAHRRRNVHGRVVVVGVRRDHATGTAALREWITARSVERLSQVSE